MRRFNWLLAGVLFLNLYSYPVFATDKLIFNTGTQEPFTTADKQGFLDQVIKETFRRIGVEAEITVYQAAARALKNADLGIDDGVSLRVKGIEKKYPNLVRIPEKIMDNDFVAYAKRHYLSVKDWASLAPHDIAYILGWQIFQNNLADHKSTIRVKDVAQLMTLLERNRVDFILYERWQGLWHANNLNMKVEAIEPPLAQMEMFMYLHKKHAGLADKAAASLAEMKKDGTYQKIFDRTLTRLLH